MPNWVLNMLWKVPTPYHFHDKEETFFKPQKAYNRRMLPSSKSAL